MPDTGVVRHGFVEGVVGRIMSGWVVDLSMPDAVATLTLTIDDVPVATFKGETPRPDVTAFGLPGDRAGFHIEIPAVHLDGEVHVLRVAFGDGTPLLFIGHGEAFALRLDASGRPSGGMDAVETPARSTDGDEPVKAAVCLIVKNEASDIASWLAWYHVLGFDACIVYDDDSSDDTWEVVSRAALVQDIRLFKSVGDRHAIHDVRQISSYVHAIETFKGEFDWIGFFDADEFLSLNAYQSIKDFLARFPGGGAVSVNWCNYGSSGHVLKPKTIPVEAYTWHFNQDHPVNRHVKTLLHLDSWTGRFINMHCFDVAPGKAYHANGDIIEWSTTLGITANGPDWSVAKLMHYQCRSMEHFVERVKKLPNLMSNLRHPTDLWDAYNINASEDRHPLRLVAAVVSQMARYEQATSHAERAVEERETLVSPASDMRTG